MYKNLAKRRFNQMEKKYLLPAFNDFCDEISISGYSRKTVESYTRCIFEYFESIIYFCMLKKPSTAHIKAFLKCKAGMGLSSSTLNIYLCSIKFYYQRVARSKRKIHVKFVKKIKRLPVVLTRGEILKCVEVTKNPKHKLMIELAYGSGMRVSEVVSLKVCDLDFERKSIHIRQSKGGRDRLTILPEKLDGKLQDLVRWKLSGVNPRDRLTYLFESQRGGRLTTSTLQKVFKKSLLRAGVIKDASFHSLRHSFATHLIENGTNLVYVQKLLGHKDMNTTLTYVGIAKGAFSAVCSPL